MFNPAATSQPLATRYFQRVFASGRLSHAYLFWGARGSGKFRFALEVAKALDCERGQPCGDCSVCRGVDHGNDPSVHVFAPDEDKAAIGIETVRTLCKRIQLKGAKTHVVILRQAELLGEPAANALLKTLEEPPPGAVLILTAHSTGSLLSTLVSRCHRIPFTLDSQLASDDGALALMDELVAEDFFLEQDPKSWLGEKFPEAASARESTRALLERLVIASRDECERVGGNQLDPVLHRLELLFELLEAVDGNAQADLVFEKLLAELRR